MAEVNDRLSVEISASVQKLLDGLKKASDATGEWADRSGRQVEKVSASFNGVKFEGATSKLKAETLKQIELTHMLDVARLAGDTKTAAALQEQITLMQRIRQLRSAGLTAEQAPQAAAQQGAALVAAAAAARARREEEERRERVVGNPGKALENVFSRSRVGVIEEGATKIPIFGSALEELGAAGVAAAAGLAAVGFAAEKARQSMEFAEDIQKTAAALGVTTTRLQEFDEAAISTAVGQGKARESLAQFNEVFGKYSAGLANGRSAKFLDALGFTPASARQIGDTTEALEKTLAALAKLKNPQQRASLATQLGLANFLPVLSEGVDGVEKFVAAMRDAGASGTIVSPEQIRQAAELNDKVEVLTHRIDQEFKAAFISLAPEVEKVAEFIESCASKLAKFIGELPDAIKGLEEFAGAIGKDQDPAKQDLLDRADTLLRESNRSGIGHTLDADNHLEIGAFGGAVLTGRAANLKEGIAKALGGKVDFSGVDQDTRPVLGVDLTPPPKAKKGAADETGDLDKTAADDAAEAAKAVLEAQAALTKNIQAHADAEKAAIDVEADKKAKDLAAEEVKVRASKNDAHKASQVALLQAAQADTLTAAASKKDLIDRQAEQAQDLADLQFNQQIDEYADAIKTAQASIADTAQKRADLQLQVLKDEQARAYELRRLQNAGKVSDGSLTQNASDQDLAGLRGEQNAQLDARREQEKRSANPLYSYSRPTTSVGQDVQGIEVQGLEGFTSALVDATSDAKSFGDSLRQTALSVAQNLLKMFLTREIDQPLAAQLFGAQNPSGNSFVNGGQGIVGDIESFIPHFASGTDDAPGGLTNYNEKGVEGYVPPGAQIIPNDVLRSLSQMTPDKLGAGGQGAIIQQFHLHAEGAVMTDELMRNLDARSQAYAASAIASGKQDAKRAQASSRQDLRRF